jgi:hypothetical protein
MAERSICQDCFHSYVCEQYNENKDDNNEKCHFFNNHFVPAADVVEVKHGEWKWDKRFSNYTCSLCHNWDLTTPNYCSNCGAKMDGTQKERGVDK